MIVPIAEVEEARIVTGAAGAGKTTVCRALAGAPGMVVVDGDVIAAGARAVAIEPPDHLVLWAYVRTLAREVGRNQLVRVGSLTAPHRYDVLDTTGRSTDETTSRARLWLRVQLARMTAPDGEA